MTSTVPINTFMVPTCGRPAYNLLSPYDTDLKTAFEYNETTNFDNEKKSTCNPQCSKDLKGLAYENELYNCAVCMGLNSTNITSVTKPQLASSWGCASCYDVIAPIAYYKNTISNTTTSPNTVTPGDITKYFTVSDFQISVDHAWTNASQLNKGATVRRYCVESPSFTMKTPDPQECKYTWSEDNWSACDPLTMKKTRAPTIITPPSNGGAPCPQSQLADCTPETGGGGLNGGIIAVIVIVVVLFVCVIAFLLWWRYKTRQISDSEVKSDSSPEEPKNNSLNANGTYFPIFRANLTPVTKQEATKNPFKGFGDFFSSIFNPRTHKL